MSRPSARATGTNRAVVDPAALGPIVRHIAQGTAVTRADLARETGSSRSTVSQRVSMLINVGLVEDKAEPVPSTGGRPGMRLSLNANAGLILSADLGATQARLAVSDLAGRELASRTDDINIDQEPTQILGWIHQHLDNLLTSLTRDPYDVRAVVIGLPAPVEFAAGLAVKPPLMGAWDGYPVADYFASRYPASILIDNEVNLMALGEHRENYSHLDHLLFVKIGTGIGCGIIASRQLYRGEAGAAGDIGHIRVPGSDTPCRCGNAGCLEAVASGQALAARLNQKGHNTKTARDVAALAKAGNAEARSEVRTAAQHIGDVLAAVVSFANPSAIVIGGSLAQLDEALLAGIRSGIYDRALPLATRDLPIKASTLQEKASTIGAITLAQQHLMSETGITALLSAHPGT